MATNYVLPFNLTKEMIYLHCNKKNKAIKMFNSICVIIKHLACIQSDCCAGQKLFWSTTVTMCSIIWILSIFWAAVPLMGWGVYDFEPMRTCCTLDYTRGDR